MNNKKFPTIYRKSIKFYFSREEYFKFGQVQHINFRSDTFRLANSMNIAKIHWN